MAYSVWDEIKMKVLHGNNAILQLIAINVALFLGLFIPVGLSALFGTENLSSGLGHIRDWLWIPGNFETFITRPWTLVTHFFLHSFGIRHILFNMLFLYWFGRIYEDLMGSRRTFSLYLFAGIVGGLTYLVLSNIIPIMDPNQFMVGASGAVTAIVVAAATLQPHYTVRLLFLGNVKLWMIAAFMVIIDIIFISSNTGGRFAHLSGALVGYLYVTQLRKGNDFADWTMKAVDFIKSAFKSKPKQSFKVHRNESRKSSGSGSRKKAEVSQEEIDAILDKIATSGYDSLTKREKDILFKASNND